MKRLSQISTDKFENFLTENKVFVSSLEHIAEQMCLDAIVLSIYKAAPDMRI